MATLTPEQFAQHFFVPEHDELVLELRGVNDALDPKTKIQVLSPGDAPRIDAERNWWVTVCAHTRPSKGSTTARSAAAAMAVWADLDHMNPEEAERRRLLVGLPTPSIAVNSGNGVHFYWLLKDAVLFPDRDAKASFVALLKRIARILGGDLKVADVARILRVPGTFNVKDPKNPKLCEVVSTSRHRYTLDTLTEALNPLRALTYLFQPPRRHSLTLALPGWFRHNSMGDQETCRALFRQLYENTNSLAPTESGLDGPTEDAIRRAWELPEDAVAFHPHLDASFTDCPWLKDYFLSELSTAKKRVVAERKEAVHAPPPRADDAVRVRLGDDSFAVWTPTSINRLVETVNRKGEVQARWDHVFKGSIRPVGALDLDGERVFEYDVGGAPVRGDIGELLSHLSDRGHVYSGRHAKDCLSAITHEMIGEPRHGHATYGVYGEPDGSVAVCGAPLPRKTDQVVAWERMAPSASTAATPEALADYIALLDFWHPWEILPVAGLALTAPFTPVLRGANRLVPHMFSWSAESDLGKSTAQLAFSERLFASDSTSGRGIDSPYRLSCHFDSICAPVCVEEAEGLGLKLYPTLKEAAERWLVDRRGTGDLDTLHYQARAVLLMNANNLPPYKAPERKRLIIVRYDAEAREARAARAPLLERLVSRLEPLGFDLVRRYASQFKSPQEVLGAFDEVTAQLRDGRPAWASAKRPEAWAACYFGLLVLDHSCKALALEWRAPPVADFLRDVVATVEEGMRDEIPSQARALALWFGHWRRTRGAPDAAALYCQTSKVDEDAGLDGWWITNEVIQAYNEEQRGRDSISSLKELATQAVSVFGLPPEAIFKNEQVRVKKFPDGRARRAVFLPEVLDAPPLGEADEEALGVTGRRGDGEQGEPEPASAWTRAQGAEAGASRALALPILEALRGAQENGHEGVLGITDLEKATGLPSSERQRLLAALAALVTNGDVTPAGEHHWRLP